MNAQHDGIDQPRGKHTEANTQAGSAPDSGAPPLDPFYQPWVERLADMPADASLSPDPEVLSRLMAYFQGSLGTLGNVLNTYGSKALFWQEFNKRLL